MKLHLLSDLHFEFDKPVPMANYRPPKCDVVLLAGDIAEDKTSIDWAKATFGDTPVLLTPGNHEYYDAKQVVAWTQELRDYAAGSNVQILHNDAVVIDGVQFVGATLWTDFQLYGNASYHQYAARKGLSDYKHIRRPSSTGKKRKIRTDDILEFHIASRRFIANAVRTYQGRSVVMTHHAPSERSLPEKFRSRELTPAYASNLDSFIEELSPLLWVHGHIHASSDYMIGGTRVVGNARGYVEFTDWMNRKKSELNPDFNPALILEI